MKIKLHLILAALMIFVAGTLEDLNAKFINITDQVSYKYAEELPSSFTLNKKQKLNFGYHDTPIWLKLKLNPAIMKSKVLYFDSPLSGIIEVYDNELNAIGRFGSSIHSQFKNHNFITSFFRFKNLKQLDRPIYMKLKSPHQLSSRLLISDLPSFHIYDKKKVIPIVAYTGITICLIALSIFVFAFTKEYVFLFYAAFAASFMALNMSMSGLADYILQINNFSFNKNLIFFTSLGLLSALLFSSSYLEIKKTAPRLNTAYKILYPLLCVVLLSIFFPGIYHNNFEFFGSYIDTLAMASIVLMIISGLSSCTKRKALARFYLCSWMVMLIFSSIWFLAEYSVIKGTLLTRNALIIGNTLEMLIMGLGLAYKMSFLDKQAKTAEIEKREKSNYKKLVRVLCHDMANSLFVIHNISRIINRRPEEATKKENWLKIDRATNNLRDILESVRETEILKDRSENNSNEKSCFNEVKMGEVINDALFIFDEKLKKKEIEFVLSKDLESKTVKAEKRSLSNQVINNLLSNAIKFSYPKSKIEITYKDSDLEYKELSIRDYGIGLRVEQIESFNKTGHIDSEKGTVGEKGTGYGMNLVKSYMEHFGGKISLSSGKGSGTKVSLLFPKS